MIVSLINEAVADGARATAACRTLGVAYSSYQKWTQCPNEPDKRTTRVFGPNPRALSPQERQEILDCMNSPDKCDLSLRQAYYTTLVEGRYIGSLSSVYRIFRAAGGVVRRDGTRAPVRRHKPTSFEATGVNQVWSWDITYARDANHAGRFYYIFAVIDIYSRYIVHHDVFTEETAENAVKFLRTAFDKHHIRPRSLVLHSDNGPAMKAAQTLALLEARGVQFSHSRPRVSNDNPYIESVFKTMKYRGSLGRKKFRSPEQAKKAVQKFVDDYNTQWPHSGISNVTPASRFDGLDEEICEKRRVLVEQARQQHPERWISGKVQSFKPAGSQWLNPTKEIGKA